MSGEEPDLHEIQGIGEGFVPELVCMDKIDKVIKVGSQEAKSFIKKLAREEGLFVGISSGANVLAALKLGKMMKPESDTCSPESETIVTILPDSGERYLSMDIF